MKSENVKKYAVVEHPKSSLSFGTFQSTGPLRGPTMRRAMARRGCRLFQSTGPLRGPTPATRRGGALFPISIHRPLAGPDSTAVQDQDSERNISIHRPLAGPDRARACGIA